MKAKIMTALFGILLSGAAQARVAAVQCYSYKNGEESYKSGYYFEDVDSSIAIEGVPNFTLMLNKNGSLTLSYKNISVDGSDNVNLTVQGGKYAVYCGKRNLK